MHKELKALGITVTLLGLCWGSEVWQWQGTCGTDWYQTCEIGTCNDLQPEIANNWGVTACGETPPFPGANDMALLGSGAVVELNNPLNIAEIVVESGATFTIHASITAHRIEIQPGGTVIWTDGNLQVDTLQNQGLFECRLDPYSRAFSGVFVNSGTFRRYRATSVATDMVLSEGSVFWNRSGALLELQGDGFGGADTTAVLYNSGLILKSTGNTAKIFQLRIFQAPAGSLWVSGGILDLQPARWNGLLRLGPGTEAQVSQSQLCDSVRWVGTGTVRITGSLRTSAHAWILSALTDSGKVVWQDGNIILGSGSLWKNTGNFEAAAALYTENFTGVLENSGLWVEADGAHFSLGPASEIHNLPGGTLEVHGFSGIGGAGIEESRILNEGIFRRKGSQYGTDLNNLTFQQEGLCEVLEGNLSCTRFFQNNGLTQVNSQLLGSLIFAGGTLIGSGTLDPNSPGVVFSGDTLSPGIPEAPMATLTVAGSLILDSGSVLHIQVSGPDQEHDLVDVAGGWQDSVVLHSPTLVVELTGGYVPSAAGDSVPILTWRWGMNLHGGFGPVTLWNAGETVRAWTTFSPSTFAWYLHLITAGDRLGDVNNDGTVDPRDVESLARYLYDHGPRPPVPGYADVNGDGLINDLDLVALAHRIWP